MPNWQIIMKTMMPTEFMPVNIFKLSEGITKTKLYGKFQFKKR